MDDANYLMAQCECMGDVFFATPCTHPFRSERWESAVIKDAIRRCAPPIGMERDDDGDDGIGIERQEA